MCGLRITGYEKTIYLPEMIYFKKNLFLLISKKSFSVPFLPNF